MQFDFRISKISSMAFMLRQLAKPVIQRYIYKLMCFIAAQIFIYALRNLLFSTSPLRNAAKDVAVAANTPAASKDSTQPQLQVSESCLKRLREICNDGSFLRVTVEGGGCSGFQYKFDLDSKLNEDDLQFGDGQAKVVIDTVSLEYCTGATVDYHSELIRAGFRMIANPLAEQGCSCGSSFSIKL